MLNILSLGYYTMLATIKVVIIMTRKGHNDTPLAITADSGDPGILDPVKKFSFQGKF